MKNTSKAQKYASQLLTETLLILLKSERERLQMGMPLANRRLININGPSISPSIHPRFCHLEPLNEPDRVSNVKVNLCDARGTIQNSRHEKRN